MALLKPTVLLIVLVCFAVPSLQGKSLKKSVELSLVNRVNQTDHCTIEFELAQKFRGSRRKWQAHIKHEIFEDGDLEEHVVKGLLTAPPPKPKDYELFPGLGFYKFHPEAKTFQDSLKICSEEGGHLLIINSLAEANVAKTLYSRYPDVWRWAHIGFQDKNGDGNYATIFGKNLKSAGYDTWHPDEPDHSYGPAHCGVINRESLLGGGVCEGKRPFMCEYDLSWGA